MKLVLPNNTSPKAPWLRGLVACLGHMQEYYPDAEVKYDHMQELRDIPRWNQASLLKVNGKYIYLDPWDFTVPTIKLLERMSIIDESFQHIPSQYPDVKLILKLQARGPNDWPNSRNIPVIPWTMFHTDQLVFLDHQPEYRAAYSAAPKKYKLGFTGRMWNCRRPWVEELMRLKDKYPNDIDLETWPGKQRPHEYSAGDNHHCYNHFKRVMSWKRAIILHGQHDAKTEAKNRRELEYSSMGLPIALNYHPTYFDSFTTSVHYTYIQKPEDIESLLDDESISHAGELCGNAYAWWLANASMDGICRSFVKLMRKYNV